MKKKEDSPDTKLGFWHARELDLLHAHFERKGRQAADLYYQGVAEGVYHAGVITAKTPDSRRAAQSAVSAFTENYPLSSEARSRGFRDGLGYVISYLEGTDLEELLGENRDSF